MNYLKAFEDGSLTRLEFVRFEKRTYQLCLIAVNCNGWNFLHVPNAFKTQEMCIAATQKLNRMLATVPDEHKAICKALLKVSS